MTHDQVTTQRDGRVIVTFDKVPIELPPLVGPIVVDHMQQRRRHLPRRRHRLAVPRTPPRTTHRHRTHPAGPRRTGHPPPRIPQRRHVRPGRTDPRTRPRRPRRHQPRQSRPPGPNSPLGTGATTSPPTAPTTRIISRGTTYVRQQLWSGCVPTPERGPVDLARPGGR